METDRCQGANIKVMGLGGAGSNAVDRMIQMGIRGVDFGAANTDLQALARSEAPCRIHLGDSMTRSLGAGGDPAVGERAAQESSSQIARTLHGADMVFIAAGMGGGTGTGAAPVVAQIARAAKALTIAVVTRPFTFEGTRRADIAERGIEQLAGEVDALIVVSNDRLLEVAGRRVSLDVAFRIADEVLRQAVQSISELVTRPGLINLDMADVRSVLGGAGGAVISIGYGEGPEKASEAARVALHSPLLSASFPSRTNWMLVNITGGEDLTLLEVNAAMEAITGAVAAENGVMFGAVIDPQMAGRVEITLIATGEQVERVAHAVERPERTARREVARDELSIPAFIRARQRAGLEEVGIG